MERTNARLLGPGELASHSESRFSFLAMDVSFISATVVLPSVISALTKTGDRWTGEAVVLIKPQFEAGREHVGKGGIVRDEAAHRLAIDRVRESVVTLGGGKIEIVESPITGAEGNHEFLLHADFGT